MEFDLAVTRYLEVPTRPALNRIREAVQSDER